MWISVQVEWVMPGKCTDNTTLMPGFYVKKNKVRSSNILYKIR